MIGVKALPKKPRDRSNLFNRDMFGNLDSKIRLFSIPYSNRISPLLTEFGPLPWQAKQTVSALC